MYDKIRNPKVEFLAPMLELADRHASEACDSNIVGVQLSLGALD